MKFDVLLSSVLFLITIAVMFLYSKFEKRIRATLEERKLGYRDVIVLVLVMGIMVTILAFIPGEAIRLLFLFTYSLVLFSFTYVAVQKWYLAVLSPVIFVALYLSPFWNLFLLDLFAIIFAVFVSIYLGSLFEWKTTTVFVALLTTMDVTQVLFTGFMVETAEKMVGLNLPIAIFTPTFPSQLPYFLGLGLGDIFLFGLLSIQTSQKYGKKSGLASIGVTTAIFLLLHTILLNYYVAVIDLPNHGLTEVPRPFPATVLILSGWLTALGAQYLCKSRMLRRS